MHPEFKQYVHAIANERTGPSDGQAEMQQNGQGDRSAGYPTATMLVIFMAAVLGGALVLLYTGQPLTAVILAVTGMIYIFSQALRITRLP